MSLLRPLTSLLSSHSDFHSQRPQIMDGWEDGRMNESPNVFYRTVSFSRPLPCFPHSDTKSNKAGQRVSLTTYCPWATGSLLWQWSANLSVQTLSSRAVKLYGNKREGLWSSMGPTCGLQGPKLAINDQNLDMFVFLTFFWRFYFVRLKVDELIYHTCTILLE